MKVQAAISLLALSVVMVSVQPPVQASSHREAPFITEQPKLDGTDFYMFNSYEPNRKGFVTLIANYLPLQDAYGGPNYFTLDPEASYNINIDNNGDANPDLSFQFKFTNTNKNISLPVGGKSIPVPIINVGPISSTDNSNLNVQESYTLNVVRGNASQPVTRAGDRSRRFGKPVDNIGNKSIPNYADYANRFVYNVDIPGCGVPGRLFVGQRKDPFVVNLGETFDLVNVTNVLGPVRGERDDLGDKNITSLVLEVAANCLTNGSTPTIAGWTTSSSPVVRLLRPPGGEKEIGPLVQQSRLANPLVNELVIGLKDKDKFNASKPVNDGQFADYITNPTLPAILELLFGNVGVKAPTVFPRTDLVSVFLTGVDGLNKTNATAEMMRLNTSTPAVPAAAQNNLGVIGGDLAGYPNGRRPGDDVVDISLRVAMGALLPPEQAPSGKLGFTDGAFVDASFFDSSFPYLKTPIAGSPNDTAP
jgi:Domain of unknown function (DUF4331)